LQLSIIIVNYNVKYFLEHCLCSVLKACRHLTAEVWVVDNNSTDNSRSYFMQRFASVKFIWNDDNIGFARANNLALAKARGQHILFLNPDTILAEDTLELCLDWFDKNRDTGALGVKMLDGRGVFLPESKRGFPSFWASVFKFTGLSAVFPQSAILARYYSGHLPANCTHPVEVISGAFMMVPKNILDQTGGFDEAYFMYAEDIDLSYRIQKAGFSNTYFAGTTIVHFKGESTQKNTDSYVKHFYGAMQLFVKKYYQPPAAFFLRGMLQLFIWIKLRWLPVRKYIYKKQTALPFRHTAALAMITAEELPQVSLLLADKFAQITRVTDTEEVHHPAAIICSASVLSYKQTIEMIENASGSNSAFYWYNNLCNSIINSNHPGTNGQVVL
jgi:GT2 family glycosyltransferase